MPKQVVAERGFDNRPPGLGVHMGATPLVRKDLSQTRITALDGFAKKLSSRVRCGTAGFCLK
jgi:hypothetical protein